jgi:hypothetical protein
VNEEIPDLPEIRFNEDGKALPVTTEKERICQATDALWNTIDYHTKENCLTYETVVGILEGIKYEMLKRWHGDDEDPEEDWKN